MVICSSGTGTSVQSPRVGQSFLQSGGYPVMLGPMWPFERRSWYPLWEPMIMMIFLLYMLAILNLPKDTEASGSIGRK